jgi:hypothetical protein
VALCGLSGATTTTVPISAITAISARIPGAEIPSSLVTKIKGLLVFIGLNYQILWTLNFKKGH